MGINSATFAFLQQQVGDWQPLVQPLPPVQQPVVEVEPTPMQQASEAQAVAADALTGARQLGDAWTGFLGQPEAPAPVVEAAAPPAPALSETGFSAEQTQAIQEAAHRAEVAMAGGQEAYDRRNAEIEALKAANPQGYADAVSALQNAVSGLQNTSYNNPQNHQFVDNLNRTITADQATQLSLALANSMTNFYTANPPAPANSTTLANFFAHP